jgi:membrane protein YqaA with SNARE-associated domain
MTVEAGERPRLKRQLRAAAEDVARASSSAAPATLGDLNHNVRHHTGCTFLLQRFRRFSADAFGERLSADPVGGDPAALRLCRHARGEIGVPAVIVAGTLGSGVGALLWYYAGRWVGVDRLKRFAASHGRWLTLTPSEIDRVDRWFDRRGRWAVLFGRMIPGIRTLISVPAGVSGMPLVPFLVATFAGSAIWTSVLVVAASDWAPGIGRWPTSSSPPATP